MIFSIASFWQHIPENIDPVVFSIGPFSFYWYAVFFLLGWAVAVGFLFSRVAKKEFILGKEVLWDIALVSLTSAIIGGRLGYATFYEQSLFSHPLLLINPFSGAGEFVGIRGMSFHGALFGAFLGIWIVARKAKVRLLSLLDFIVIGAPLAIFFGRIGNFVNLELFGRVTEVPWGMYAPSEDVLRHPSQLYEAGAEGLLLFFILYSLRKKAFPEGVLSGLFLFFYGVFRFAIEFVRERDPGVSGGIEALSMGQSLSLGMIMVSIGLFVWIFFRKNGILSLKKKHLQTSSKRNT